MTEARKRGRPPTGKALSAAERNRRYREKLKAKTDHAAILVTETISQDMAQQLGQMRLERDLARDQVERLQADNSRLVTEIKDLERQILHLSKSKHSGK